MATRKYSKKVPKSELRPTIQYEMLLRIKACMGGQSRVRFNRLTKVCVKTHPWYNPTPSKQKGSSATNSADE